MSFGFSDICKLVEDHVPYGNPGDYGFPTGSIVVGDPPGPSDPQDRTCINRFGVLRDFGKKPGCPQGQLQVQLVGGKAEPAPGSVIDKAHLEAGSFHLVCSPSGNAYNITKGFRIPYTYKDINGATVHTNLFILFSGAGQA